MSDCEEGVTCEGVHEVFQTTSSMDLYTPNSPPPDVLNDKYLESKFVDYSCLVAAKRAKKNFRNKTVRVQIIPKGIKFYRGTQGDTGNDDNGKNPKYRLQPYPQYFSSLDIAQSYTNRRTGAVMRVCPTRNLEMFDLSHSPSIEAFLELMYEEKLQTEPTSAHYKLLEKWIIATIFATGIYLDENEDTAAARYEELAERLNLKRAVEQEVRGGKEWLPQYNMVIKEYDSDQFYEFGTDTHALLRSSYTHVDYIIVEALKHVFPELDGYAAGYTPTRSFIGVDAFPPEMCVLTP